MVLIGVGALVASPSFAEEASLWKGNLELGYLQTGGNTNSQTLSSGGKAERPFDHAKLSGEFSAIYGERENVASDKNWMGRLKYDHYMSSRAFAYLVETVERDILKGIEIRYASQGGLGYELVKTPKNLLKAELGAGYVRENPKAADASGNRLADRGYPSARAYGEYGHGFDGTTRFLQTVEYLPILKDGEGYLFKEESSLIANVMGSFALKMSYAIAYDSKPQPGFDRTDRVFKTSLLYTF